MRPIVAEGGRVIGRAALYPSRYGYPGALVAGGLRVIGVQHLLGVIFGEVATAARDKGRVPLPPHALSRWATEQVKLIERSDLPAESKAICAEFALRSKSSIFGLPVVRWGGKWLNLEELDQKFEGESEVPIFVGDLISEDDDGVPSIIFDEQFELSNDILFIPILDSGHSYLKDIVLTLLELKWEDYEQEDEISMVGHAGGSEILRHVELFRRKHSRRVKS